MFVALRASMSINTPDLAILSFQAYFGRLYKASIITMVMTSVSFIPYFTLV